MDEGQHSALESFNVKTPMTAPAAQEPFNQKNLRPRVNDSFGVSGARECQSWTSTGNDRSGEPNKNS